ncbi:hypothetical protein PMAYCL1PPCAC_14067, partial [Pristionchus mayeri]
SITTTTTVTHIERDGDGWEFSVIIVFRDVITQSIRREEREPILISFSDCANTRVLRSGIADLMLFQRAERLTERRHGQGKHERQPHLPEGNRGVHQVFHTPTFQVLSKKLSQ